MDLERTISNVPEHAQRVLRSQHRRVLRRHHAGSRGAGALRPDARRGAGRDRGRGGRPADRDDGRGAQSLQHQRALPARTAAGRRAPEARAGAAARRRRRRAEPGMGRGERCAVSAAPLLASAGVSDAGEDYLAQAMGGSGEKRGPAPPWANPRGMSGRAAWRGGHGNVLPAGPSGPTSAGLGRAERPARAARAGGRHSRGHRAAHDPRRGRHAHRLRVRGHGRREEGHRLVRGRPRSKRWRARCGCRPDTSSSGPGSTNCCSRCSRACAFWCRSRSCIVLLLLYMNFGNLTEALIVLASVPFALVGSVWLMRSAALQPVDRGVGRHHRAGGPRGADRRGDDRVLRQRVSPLQGRRAASATSTTSSRPRSKARSSACGPSS